MDKVHTIIGKTYLVLILLVPVIPQSNTMDVVGLQWFVFSILNVLGLISVFANGQRVKDRSSLLALWLIFLGCCALSVSYSINQTLALQDVSRWVQLIISIYIISKLIRKKIVSFDFIVNTMVFVLFVEMIYILIPLILQLYLNGLQMVNVNALTPGVFNGLTGNKNIAAAAVMVKLPFVVYKIKKLNLINSIYSYLIIVFAILSVLFIAARASYISFIIFSIFIFIAGIFYIKGSVKKKLLYYFLPIIIAYTSGFVLSNKFIPSGSTTSLANKVSSISFTRAGSSGRTLLWSDAISFAKEHPLIGGGIGSWKIESAPYWNIHGNQYLVPYHAHNDFLEITAELGFIGGMLYLAIFLRLLYLFFKRAKNLKKTQSLFYFICLTSLGIYLVDAFFNFPMERYIMQVSLCILMGVGIYAEKKEKYEKES